MFCHALKSRVDPILLSLPLAICILYPAAAGAATVTLRAEVDRRELTMDENVALYVTFDFSEQNIQTGDVAFPSTRDFEVASQSSQQQVVIVNGALSVKRTLVFNLMPTRDGTLTIPPIRSFYVDPATGKRVELEAPPIDVKVNKVEEKKPLVARRDEVVPVIDTRSPASFALTVLLATLAAITLVGFGLTRFLRRHGDKPRSPVFDLKLETNAEAERLRQAAAPAAPPDLTAAISRERLALLARESEREFAREVGRLVKELLERGSGKPFAGRTTAEILEQIGFLRLGGEARTLVEELLAYTDEVSYCAGGGAPDRRDDTIEKLRRLSQLVDMENRR